MAKDDLRWLRNGSSTEEPAGKWTAEAVKALQKAVETHLRGDNDADWAGVARELGTTADFAKEHTHT